MNALSLLLPVLLLLTGCIQKPSVSPLTLDGTLEPFYSQTVEWHSCGALECAEFTVPVDYNDLSGETIQISINRHVAGDSASRLGSIVSNPGGPGGSGIDYVEAYEQVFTPQIIKQFDLVGFDPRGVGSSAPIECSTDAEKDEGYASESTPDTAAEVKEFEKPFDMTACADKTGELFAHVSTVEVVKDLDILREILGDARLNYLGKSYGTQIGAVYASMFPENVGQFVLDGAVDMKLSPLDLTVGQAAGFEGELKRFATYCVEVYGDCPLGSTESAMLSKLFAFLKQLDSKPLKTDDADRKLTESHVWNALFGSMYAPDWTWDWLIESLDAGYEGDGTGLLDMSDWQAGRNPDGTYMDNSYDAFTAISCLDYPYADFKRADLIARAKEAAPLLGEVFGWMEGGCKNWPVTGIPMPSDISAAADAATTIVVVGTVNDPATPVQWARSLTEELGNAVYLEFNGDGHTAYMSGSKCIDSRIDEYFITGRLPKNSPICQPDEPILGAFN